MTPYLLMVISGFSLFAVVLFWVWIWTGKDPKARPRTATTSQAAAPVAPNPAGARAG